MKHPFQKGSRFLLEQDANTGQQRLLAYVVDAQGQLVEKQPIDTKGGFAIPNADKLHHEVRLFIAPELPDNPNPSLQDLLDVQAYEPVIHKRLQEEGAIHLLPVPEIMWPYWNWCFCRVRGRVVREFCLSWPINFCFQLPVCPARVHVCRVKRRIMWELSPAAVAKLRDQLVAVPKFKIPIPEPDPLPFRQLAMARTENVALDNRQAQNSDLISQTLLFKLQTTNTDLLRRALDEHFYEIRPLIPYLNLCSLLYRSDEFMTIEVDHDGRFDRSFVHPCNEENDLYFWVEYLIAGSWVTVYRPGLCSGTYWNMVCGTEVTLKVTDPRVTGCRPLTGRYMEVNRIGTGAWLPLVNNSTGFVNGLGFDDSTTDATGTVIPAGAHERPFAGILDVLGGFGSNLPDPAQATHFRVSLKRIADADVPANWKVLQNPLYRGYRDDIELNGVTKPYDKQFLLNEPGQPEFYKIPHNEASDQTEIALPTAPATLIDREWSTTEFALASIDTDNMDLGLDQANTYDIRIELCRTVGGVLQPVAARRELFQIPDPANFNDNIIADDTHIYPAPVITDALGMRIRVRIDRRMTTCSIDDAKVDGVAADPQCGLLNYAPGSTAQLGFRVAHPDNRATFSFGVVRGNGQAVQGTSPNTSGLVNAPTAFSGYNRGGDNFTNSSFSVADMLSVPASGGSVVPTPCAGAAFAENLYVKAMATDGSYRLSKYDSSAPAAFAIIKDCECDA